MHAKSSESVHNVGIEPGGSMAITVTLLVVAALIRSTILSLRTLD